MPTSEPRDPRNPRDRREAGLPERDERRSATAPREDRHRDDARSDPWTAMRRWMDQMQTGWPLSSSFSRRRIDSPSPGLWMPEIESFQRGDEFVVRADLPGLDRRDITIDVQDDALVIQGERSNEHETHDEGRYTTERTYGQFCRIVPLPEGALTESAKATFRDGVLEVVMTAPPQETRRGRRIEIGEGGGASR